MTSNPYYKSLINHIDENNYKISLLLLHLNTCRSTCLINNHRKYKYTCKHVINLHLWIKSEMLLWFYIEFCRKDSWLENLSRSESRYILFLLEQFRWRFQLSKFAFGDGCGGHLAQHGVRPVLPSLVETERLLPDH